MSSSEAIAKVVRDIKTGRVVDPADSAHGQDPELVDAMRGVHRDLIQLAMGKEFPCAVIDSTSMYEQITHGPSVTLYDEYRIMPVWDNALIGYENQWGNVNIIQTYAIHSDDMRWEPSEWGDTKPPYAWETTNPVEWERVKYRFVAVLWVGGRSQGQTAKTIGPIYRWDVAAYEDGEMADIRWTALYNFLQQDPVTSEALHQNAMLIWLQTFTLAGCTNVELVTPQRSKPERKRLARLDVNPQTIVIKKTSKTYRHHKDDTKDMIGGVPQRFVKGHYARYGAEYDRGLLFGKYSGKFWIPARAAGESGREIDYVIEVG